LIAIGVACAPWEGGGPKKREGVMSVREETLQRVLRELPGLAGETVCVTSHFSELGMDSLLGLRFARKLQDVFGVEIEPEWLFDHPSVDQFALFLDQRFGALDGQAAL
jgi:acyl carrier protein